MAAKKEEEIIVDVEEVYSKSQTWVLENQKSLTIIVGAVVLMIVSYFAYNNFVYAPQEEKARESIVEAQEAFAIDSLELALNGDANVIGFLEIIDNYNTETANLAHYYAGICYLRLGQYNEAIQYLEDFDCDDIMVCAVAIGATGDAYMELGDTEKAIDYYNGSIEHSDNELTAPIYLMKLGYAYEVVGNYTAAAEAYTRIKYDYPESLEAQSIDKYIARAEASATS